MTHNLHDIAASFDGRALNYSRSDWHRQHAERLVQLADPAPGHRVLDAGAGTGFATCAIARRIQPGGHVVGIDISGGMLERAQQAVSQEGLQGVELLQRDATELPAFSGSTFDVVICATALLYMPVDKALREWHRLLKDEGTLAFSGMRAGSPLGGRLFRECARSFGISLEDPCHELGSEERCRAALERAGFSAVKVVAEPVLLSNADLANAWESNFRAAGHAAVRRLDSNDREALRASYEHALRRQDEMALRRADVLYAFARKRKTVASAAE